MSTDSKIKMKNSLITVLGIMIAIGIIALVTRLMLNPAVDGNTKMKVSVAIAIAAIVTHIIALVKVKRGTLTVYRNWTDFGVSCAWPIAAFFAVILLFVGFGSSVENSGAKMAWKVGGGIFVVITVIGLIWMFVGAFTNNKGKLIGGIIALFARTTATLFFLTWLSKLLEVKRGCEDSNVGINDYIKSVAGFIILGFWFKLLVVPLVKDNREDVFIDE